jgi:hypothetical protein
LAQTQIRGPALIGPGLQIRGPGQFTALAANGDDLTAEFDAATALNQGIVGILMAANQSDISELSARWPAVSDPGWYVGTQTSDAGLQAAYADAGAGNPLRVLIARRVVDVVWLSQKWPNCA